MVPKRVAFLLLLFVASVTAQTNQWTNQAGHVITASVAGFDGTTVALLRTNGSIVRLPLSALRPADQQRVLAASGRSSAPAFVLAAYRDATVPLERFEKLPSAQKTADGRIQAAYMACAVFDARLNPHKAELTNEVAIAEVKRLRGLLATGNPISVR